MVSPLAATQPAMPRLMGSRISCWSKPIPTSDQISPRSRSIRKTVPRSAPVWRVVSCKMMFRSSARSSVELSRLVASTIVESSMTALRRSLLSSATSAYRLNKSNHTRVLSSSGSLSDASSTPTGSPVRPSSHLWLVPSLPDSLPRKMFWMPRTSGAGSSPLSCQTAGAPSTMRQSRAPSSRPGAARARTIWAASSPGSVSGLRTDTTCSSVSIAVAEATRGVGLRFIQRFPCTEQPGW